MRRLVVMALAVMVAAAAPAPTEGTLVAIGRQPRTWMETAARSLLAQDLAEAGRSGERPLLLVGNAKLGAGAVDRPALFVQLQSARECGSAGCNTQVFVWRGTQWVRVLDGVGGRVFVSPKRTNGMADLVSDGERYVWTGTAYRDANPAPAIDLRPRRPIR